MRLYILGTSEELTWADWLGIGLVLASLVLCSVLIDRYAAPVGRPLP